MLFVREEHEACLVVERVPRGKEKLKNEYILDMAGQRPVGVVYASLARTEARSHWAYKSRQGSVGLLF